jgi:hypothetical protein
MKIPLFGLLLVVAWCGKAAGAEWQPLFDGTLHGWRTWLSFPEPTSTVPGLAQDAAGKYAEKLGWDRDPLKVFSVVNEDGAPAIRASGEVFGLILTDRPYRNFHLRLQFKWGERKWTPRLEAPRDSGLLYFVNGEQGRSYVSWPASLELQIQEKDTGDLYALLSRTSARARYIGADAKGNPHWIYDPSAAPVLLEQEGRDGNRCIRLQDFEKSHGEWNTIEVVCLGSDSVHIVNGQVVMRLTGARKQPGGDPLDEGLIGLQSEGAEIFFRAIEIRALDAMPGDLVESR